MNLAEWLVRTARRLPNAPALMCGTTVVASYGEFLRRVASLASAFQTRLRVRPGDRIAIIMPNCIEYLELLYAAWFAGAAVVPINWKLHPKEVTWIAQNAEVTTAFVSGPTANELMHLIGECPDISAVIEVEDTEFGWLRKAE